jgi:hypothetical protein
VIAINAGLAIGFAAAFVKYCATPSSLEACDFSVFWTAWNIILHGPVSGLYDATIQRLAQQRLLDGGYFEGGLMAFVNPPHAALASVPVGWLAERFGRQAAFIIWACGNIAVLALFVRAVCDEWGSTTRRQRLVIASAVAGFYPVFCAFKNGQTSILLALAILGVYRAANANRAWVGAAWIAALSIKPQLVPMVFLYLAARRNWRLVGCAAVVLLAIVSATAVVLGPRVWVDYLTKIHGLELYWGTGTPVYMMNLRGVLTRVFGLSAQSTIDAFCYAIWVSAMGMVGLVMVVRRVHEADDPRPAFAFAIAIALLSNPHLFIHDTIIWTIPLLLFTAARRDAGLAWEGFAGFALLWPVVFYLGSALLNRNSGRLIWLDPEMAMLVTTTTIIGLGWAAARTRRVSADLVALDAGGSMVERLA